MKRRDILALLLLCAIAPTPALAGGESTKKKAGGISYLPIATLAGATKRPYGKRGVMTVECGIDVPDGGLRDRAQKSLPRLRAAYAEIVQVYAAGLPIGAAPNADFLSRALQNQTNLILGKPGATLLLGAILVN